MTWRNDLRRKAREWSDGEAESEALELKRQQEGRVSLCELLMTCVLRWVNENNGFVTISIDGQTECDGEVWSVCVAHSESAPGCVHVQIYHNDEDEAGCVWWRESVVREGGEEIVEKIRDFAKEALLEVRVNDLVKKDGLKKSKALSFVERIDEISKSVIASGSRR